MTAEPRYDVSVIGLGKLGLPMAVCFAAKGQRVLAVDADPAVLARLEAPVLECAEPGISALYAAHRANLRASASIATAVEQSSVVFIMVATPMDDRDEFSLEHVLRVASSIGDALRATREHRLIVLSSTVMPGGTEIVQRTLEERSGRRCGEGFGLCYSPELFALGSIADNLYRPDVILLGESDPSAGARLVAFYERICDKPPKVSRANFVNTELAKLAINTYVSTKITFANVLASLCEQLPGADVDAVTATIGLDARIGGKFLKGGLSFGGPCFPRDQKALVALGRRLGAACSIAQAVTEWNDEWARGLMERVLALREPGARIGVLGLAFKPGSDLLVGSGGFELAQALARMGEQVTVHDPLTAVAARAVLGDSVRYAGSAQACVEECDVVVIATPWPDYRGLQAALSEAGRAVVIVDCWRMLDRARLHPRVRCVAIGVGPQPATR